MNSYKIPALMSLGLIAASLTGCGTTTIAETHLAYTLTDVTAHSTAESCWMVIHNQVYDVTTYIPQHPGQTRILDGCGKDATDLFTGTNPVGRVHSTVAQALLEKYHIGELAL